MEVIMEDETTKNVESAYSNIVQDYGVKVKSHDLDHRYIERFLSLFSAGQKILDIGAGTGTISNEMQSNHQLDVTAIDLSKEMVNLAKKNYPNLKIIRMDLRKLEFPDNSFDGAFANYSLIHVPETNIPQTLNEIARILKPRGHFYLALQEPITPMDKDGYYSIVYKKEVKMFINLFTESDMQGYLKSAGYSVVSVDRRSPAKETEFPFNKLFIIAQKQ
jgi:ubiquinone/menaquinone biosynthesis C-methylase UbiE